MRMQRRGRRSAPPNDPATVEPAGWHVGAQQRVEVQGFAGAVVARADHDPLANLSGPKKSPATVAYAMVLLARDPRAATVFGLGHPHPRPVAA